MTSCDHGVALDRYCSDCDWDLLEPVVDPPTDREWSRLVVLVCCAALLLIALYLGSGARG